MVWWLRICLAMQGMWVRSSGNEDPTCHGTMTTVPPGLESLCPAMKLPHATTKTQHSQIKKKKKNYQ